MSWTVAKSLQTLLAQVNALAPTRSKVSDGTIGDTAHAARKSDHNPDSNGVVRALDITHDPGRGLDAGLLAEALRKSNDPRISYIIWNRRIWNPSISDAWRPASGHTMHVHVSVKGPPHRDDPQKWLAVDVLAGLPQTPSPPLVEPPKTLRLGSTGTEVAALWNEIVQEEKDTFGPILEAAVRAYQKKKGLTVDGVVGPYTWGSLKKE